MRRKQLTITIKTIKEDETFFYRKFIRFVIKHFTIVINNTIQLNDNCQYIEHMNNYQGKEDEKCLDKE